MAITDDDPQPRQAPPPPPRHHSGLKGALRAHRRRSLSPTPHPARTVAAQHQSFTRQPLADAKWGFWELPAALIPLGYVNAVVAAGGRPVILPPVLDSVPETLAALGGLIISGGPDLDPAAYGQKRAPGTTPTAPERDAAELALLRAALALDMPVLGICRGMQLINVAYGGALVQHLPDLVGHDGHRTRPGRFDVHPVEIASRTRTRAILGQRAEVCSGHHQGLDAIGAGLEAVAWAPDGSVEAIEDPRRRFLVGVLWHPEEGDDRRLFEALISAAG